jgi:hypothetical protein
MLFSLVCCGQIWADESHAAAKKCFEFWQPHAGVWTITLKEEGRDDISATYGFQPSPSKLCYLSQATLDDGTVVGNGLHGYDAAEKCWFDTHFTSWEGQYISGTARLYPKVEEGLRAGTKVPIEATTSMGGETITFKAIRVYETVDDDKIVYVARNRKTKDGEALPDTTFIWERKK